MVRAVDRRSGCQLRILTLLDAESNRGKVNPALTKQSVAAAPEPNDEWIDALALLNSSSYIWPPAFTTTGTAGTFLDNNAEAGPSTAGPSSQPFLMPDAQLMKALQTQTARIEESFDGDLELYYYRFVRCRGHLFMTSPEMY